MQQTQHDIERLTVAGTVADFHDIPILRSLFKAEKLPPKFLAKLAFCFKATRTLGNYLVLKTEFY